MPVPLFLRWGLGRFGVFRRYAFLYGSCAFLLFVPACFDSYLSQTRYLRGRVIPGDSAVLFLYSVGVVATGIACRLLTYLGHLDAEVRRAARLRNLGHCAGCGYDLTGNVSGLCPECGAPAPAMSVEHS